MHFYHGYYYQDQDHEPVGMYDSSFERSWSTEKGYVKRLNGLLKKLVLLRKKIDGFLTREGI